MNGVATLDGSINNPVIQNMIYDNLVLGIDLNMDGFTANDVGDADEGANRLQNSPALLDIIRQSNGDLAIDYTVDTDLANATYPIRVEFYQTNPSNQAKTYLGFDTFTAANAAVGIKTILVTPLDSIDVGDQLVATATDLDGLGNTSEISTKHAVT